MNLTLHEREILKSLEDGTKYPQYRNKPITYSALYCDELLENGDVEFPILAADQGKAGTKNKSERRLALNEVFIPTRLKMVIKRVDGATGSEKHAQAVHYTYPNKSVFKSSNASTYKEDDLWAIWNGFLSMQYQTTVYEPGIETARFLYVPEFQGGEYTTNDASTAITTTRYAADAHQPEFGEILLTSYPHLAGNVQHKIHLSIPNSNNLLMKNTNSNQQNFLRLIMRGFIIQNMA